MCGNLFFYEIFVNEFIFSIFVARTLNKFRLSDGVTGNTSDFGSEESRFEP